MQYITFGVKKEEHEALKKEKEELEQRVDRAVKMMHNIRRYSEVYTPIREGCEDVLRVLKGRPIKHYFKARDWYKISGRGDVAVVECEVEQRPKIGDIAVIDGKEYTVRGVEIMGNKKPIGLLV